MKKLTRSLSIMMFMVGIMALTSCQSKEDRVINQMKDLAENIDENGRNFDADDWEEALEDLAEIHEDMEDCEFTPKQLHAIGKLDGRLTVIIAREGARAAGQGVTDYIRSAGSFLKGFEQGSKSTYDQNEEEFNKIGNDFASDLDSVMKEINELE